MQFGDIGMYDLFLHKQDIAYTIPQLYEFVEKAGLNFVEHGSPHSRIMLQPKTYIKDPELLARIEKMDKVKQQAMCEIMCGSIIKHDFYVSKKKDPVARITDLDNVPYFHLDPETPKKVSDYLKINKHLIGGKIDYSWKSDFFGDVTVHIPVSEYTEHLFRHMIDEKSLKEVFAGIEKDMGKKIKKGDLMDEINRVFLILDETGLLLLRNKKLARLAFYESKFYDKNN